MEIPESGGNMEGWLYLIRFNRFGLQYSRKRYFILEENYLKSFKTIPTSGIEEPARSAIIDSCIRVTDNGRESHHRRTFFIFTLYNTSDHNDQLKLGASSSEEAAKWIHSLQDAALNPRHNLKASSRRKYRPFRLSVSKRDAHKNFADRSSASWMHVDAMTSDVIAPSPWKIFGCQNGLRFFKEAKERDSGGRVWDDHPAILAVGVIDGSSEAIFRLIMSLGPSRSEWDFCFYRGNVVEHLDGHTDIIHVQLYRHWLPWGMKRRDLLLRRYWRREDDGTYVILYHSVVHSKCPPQPGYVRACLKSGGFVICPCKQGKGSVVKHMLAIDWKFWNSYLQKASARSITINLLGRVSALRELFRPRGKYSSESLSGEMTRGIGLTLSEMEVIKVEVDAKRNQDDKMDGAAEGPLSRSSSLVGLNDVDDEFFDVLEPSDDDHLEHSWNASSDTHYMETYDPKLSSSTNFVKRLHDRAVQKKGYVDVQEMQWEDGVSCYFGATLQKDPNCSMPCSWAAGDPSSYLIRGSTFLEDRQKIKAKCTLMQLVAADWIRSDKPEDNLGGRLGSIVQKSAARGAPEFFFVVNLQLPGTSRNHIVLYYMLNASLEEAPLLERFVNGDDAFRNSRFKLIPYISKGSWIAKQSVAKKPCLIGQQVEVHYHRGDNYLELDIDIGSSTVARGVSNLVLGYFSTLVLEIAFLIQANTEEELPEVLLGTCRLNHLDISKSVPIDSMTR